MKNKKSVAAAARNETEMYKKEQEQATEDAATTLSQYFMFIVAMVTVVYIGFHYQEMSKDIESNFFSLHDNCGNLENKHNLSYYQYSLNSLKLLGSINVPTTGEVTDASYEDPQSWILNGDSITKVDGNYWYIAVDTDMSGISGDMLRSWFENVNCSDMYRWWHPRDHVWGVWVEDESYNPSTSLVARQGMIHRVKEKIGGKMNKLDIFFQDPCVGKDCEVLRTQGVELVLSGKVHVYLTPIGRVYGGFFIHTLRVDDSGSTLHSRFTMGRDIHCLDNPDSWACFSLDLFQWFVKKIMLSEKNARNIFIHCKEEMYTLGRLIARMNNISSRE